MDLLEHSRRTLAYLQFIARRDLLQLRAKSSQLSGQGLPDIHRRLKETLEILQGPDRQTPSFFGDDDERDDLFLDHLIRSLEDSPILGSHTSNPLVPSHCSSEKIDNFQVSPWSPDGEQDTQNLCSCCSQECYVAVQPRCSVCYKRFCGRCFGMWSISGCYKWISTFCCKLVHACPQCEILVAKQRHFHQKMVLGLESGVHCSVRFRQTPSLGEAITTPFFGSALSYNFDRNVFVWTSSQWANNHPMFEYYFHASDISYVLPVTEEASKDWYVDLILQSLPYQPMEEAPQVQAFLSKASEYPLLHRVGLAPSDRLKFSYILGKANASEADLQSLIDPGIQPHCYTPDPLLLCAMSVMESGYLSPSSDHRISKNNPLGCISTTPPVSNLPFGGMAIHHASSQRPSNLDDLLGGLGSPRPSAEPSRATSNQEVRSDEFSIDHIHSSANATEGRKEGIQDEVIGEVSKVEKEKKGQRRSIRNLEGNSTVMRIKFRTLQDWVEWNDALRAAYVVLVPRTISP